MKRSSAVALTLLIVLLLVANSADFFFRQSYYEVWDSAANSLSVLRAKHFGQLYGPYSRWGFYHPGPTLFYVQAFGEWLFHDVLRWTPTPFPAQALAHALVMSSFFVAALMVFSRWQPAGRPRWWFLCGALVLAALHFGATGDIPSYDVLRGPTAFLSTWSAHALVLPFLCLLAAGSSVAAGKGEDLPVLALASGYLLQLHVAQPMFVGPVFVVGYAGLLWQAGGAAWRRFPCAHAAAGLILLFFAAPFLIDFCKGSQSNAAAILRHLHEYDSHKPFERAWFYFLMFGAYTAYNPVDNEFAAYDHAGMLAFLHAHAALYAAWALAAGLAGWALVAGVRGRGEPGGARFHAWAAGMLCLAVSLTLRWNMRQDDQMFYFNSWFTFGIYYFGALVAWATVCARLPAGSARWPGWLEPVAGVAAVLAVAAWRADALRLVDPSPAATRSMHEDIRRLEEAADAAGRRDGATRPIRMLRFEYDTSPVAVAVALQLAREGQPFATENGWHAFFGDEHSWGQVPPSAVGAGRVQTWRFARGNPQGPAWHVTTVPYLLGFFQAADDTQVSLADPLVDPAAPGGAAIPFGPGGDAKRYLVGGWFTSDEGRTWIDDPRGLLGFRAPPLPGDGSTVEITVAGLVSMLDPADAPKPQRLRVSLDGAPLGAPVTLGHDPLDLVYRVAAEPWNRRADAGHRLLIELPDAIIPSAPNALGIRGERPPIGVGLSEVRLRFIAPAAGP